MASRVAILAAVVAWISLAKPAWASEPKTPTPGGGESQWSYRNTNAGREWPEAFPRPRWYVLAS